jgi:hypothetical protein
MKFPRISWMGCLEFQEQMLVSLKHPISCTSHVRLDRVFVRERNRLDKLRI